MALTESDCITQIRGFLNEATAAFWTDAELTYWLKEGVRDFCSKSLMYEATLDITLVADQLKYTSADAAEIANMIEPYAAIYSDDSGNEKGIMKVHPRKIGNVSKAVAGTPLYYSFFNRSIYVWPYSTAAMIADNAILTILYAGITDDITDITYEYQHIPVLYACARAKQKDQKFAESQSMLSQYVMMANFERADKHAREEDTYDMFKIKSGGGEAGAK